MRTVEAAEAETRLTDLLRSVEAGETAVIARDGETMARSPRARSALGR